MKSLFVLLSLAALGGCAVAPSGPANYNARAMQRPADPSQWHVVSVTPVAPGTGARVAAETGSKTLPVEYSSADPGASTQPMYAPQPVYAPPQPIYAAPPGYYYAPAPAYYYPPVSLSLGFVFGQSWGGRGNWGRAGFGYRHH